MFHFKPEPPIRENLNSEFASTQSNADSLQKGVKTASFSNIVIVTVPIPSTHRDNGPDNKTRFSLSNRPNPLPAETW